MKSHPFRFTQTILAGSAGITYAAAPHLWWLSIIFFALAIALEVDGRKQKSRS